jgi:rhodanese-related sulfurtransferase
MMDVAVPANMKVGLAQDEIARAAGHSMPRRPWRWSGATTSPSSTCARRASARRTASSRLAARALPDLRVNIAPGGMLRALSRQPRLLFYCAFGERSAMAVQAAQDARLARPAICRRHRRLEEGAGPLDAEA